MAAAGQQVCAREFLWGPCGQHMWRSVSACAVLQGNVDPTVLFCGEAAIEAAVRDVLTKAGGRGHILNLGHGVLVGTPEEAVAHMFNLSKQIKAAELVTA